MFYLSKSLYIYIWPIWLQTVIERNRRSTWRRQLSERRDTLGGRDRVNYEMYMEAMIEWVWRCIWRPRSSWTKRWICRPRSNELRDALGGCSWALFEMHLEALVVWTWRPRSSEFGEADGGGNEAYLEIHIEAVIERVWRQSPSKFEDAHRVCDRASLEAVIEWVLIFTWRPGMCELGGRNRVSLEIYLEPVIEGVWRCTWRPYPSEIGGVPIGGQFGGCSLGERRDKSWYSVHWFTRNCANRENCVQHSLPRDVRLAGSGRQSILEWCSTWCMLYSLYAVLDVYTWSWHGEKESDDLTWCS